MLILSRKTGQSIVVNDDIVITVVAIDRNRVQVGIRTGLCADLSPGDHRADDRGRRNRAATLPGTRGARARASAGLGGH